MTKNKANFIKAGALLTILLVIIISFSAAATMTSMDIDDNSGSYIDHRVSTMDPDYLYLMTGPEGTEITSSIITVTVIDTKGVPVTGLSSDAFVFSFYSVDRSVTSKQHFTLQTGPKSTNQKGQITFSISTTHAISGTYIAKVSVDGVILDDKIIITCRTADYNANGDVDIADFVRFAGYYVIGSQYADLNFDSRVNQFDFLEFREQYNRR